MNSNLREDGQNIRTQMLDNLDGRNGIQSQQPEETIRYWYRFLIHRRLVLHKETLFRVT